MPNWSLEVHNALDQWALEIVVKTEDEITKPSVTDMSVGDCPVLYNQLRPAILEEQPVVATKQESTPSPQYLLQLASECLDHLGTYSPS